LCNGGSSAEVAQSLAPARRVQAAPYNRGEPSPAERRCEFRTGALRNPHRSPHQLRWFRPVAAGPVVAEERAMRHLVVVSTLPLLLLACTDDDDPRSGPPDEVTAVLDLPATPYDYDDELPAHFAGALGRGNDNTPADNPITADGATLGRVLFHDPALSANGTIACASCHVQDAGFADPETFSVGFAGGLTTRNAMTIVDARFYRNGRFFWDERAATLEDQVLLPIQNEVEMGMTLDQLVAAVGARPYSAYLFEQAFGDAEVTSDRISRALAQFVRAAVSYRSRYDEGLAQAGDVARPFPSFTAEEERGKQLFLGEGGCARCHLDNGGPTPGPPPNQAVFLIDVPTNNGLDADTDVADLGVGAITGVATDLGRFKSPSLRNVALTAPYMHDGRLETLEDVIDHYADGVLDHPNLDPRLRAPGGAPRVLGLDADDRRALVAFLHTLTDEALIEDVRFTDPFR
jgi:cytochrome c peroxidase